MMNDCPVIYFINIIFNTLTIKPTVNSIHTSIWIYAMMNNIFKSQANLSPLPSGGRMHACKKNQTL